MNQVGLTELVDTARNNQWDGSILVALYSSKDTPNFTQDCNDVGIATGGMRVRLKGKLVELFGFNN